jgi:hypothetical protein
MQLLDELSTLRPYTTSRDLTRLSRDSPSVLLAPVAGLKVAA